MVWGYTHFGKPPCNELDYIWVRLKMGNSLLAKSFDWQMPISIFAFHWGNQADGFGTTHLFQDWE